MPCPVHSYVNLRRTRYTTMGKTDPTRREFLESSGLLVGGAWLTLQLPAITAAGQYAQRAAEQDLPFKVLTPDEARVIEAIASQIFPTDDTPGAREAEVIRFIDRALETFASSSLADIRHGLVLLQAKVRGKYIGHNNFSELNSEQQIDVLREIEDGDFFSAVRRLTVTGMFALPSYGGNRDEIGWKLIGFDHSPVFQPPFGYYDEQYSAGSEER